MAKLRPPVEWAPRSLNSFRIYGMRERADDKWEVVTRAGWWNYDEYELVAVVDSRDAAIGFVKLLRGE